MDPLTIAVIAVAAYVFLSDSPIFAPSGTVSAGGSVGPPKTDSSGHDLTGEIGAAACTIGGGVVGGIEGGPAGAALGSKLGALAAPLCADAAHYVVAGAKFVGKEAAAGAKFVAGQAAKVPGYIGKGVSFAAGEAAQVATHPLSTVTSIGSTANKIVGGVNGLTDRLTNAAYNKIPAPLKPIAKPAVVVEKTVSKAVGTAVAVGSKVGGALTGGAKTAEHAVSSAVNSVIGWL